MGEQLFNCHGWVKSGEVDVQTLAECRRKRQFSLFDELADGNRCEQLTARSDAEAGRRLIFDLFGPIRLALLKFEQDVVLSHDERRSRKSR